MTDAELDGLAKEAQRARIAFGEACAARVISEAEYNEVKGRFEAAMKAHHDALGFGAVGQLT